MLKAYKYRLYPNLEQREYLVKTFGCTRFIYIPKLKTMIKIKYHREFTGTIKSCTVSNL